MLIHDGKDGVPGLICVPRLMIIAKLSNLSVYMCGYQLNMMERVPHIIHSQMITTIVNRHMFIM